MEIRSAVLLTDKQDEAQCRIFKLYVANPPHKKTNLRQVVHVKRKSTEPFKIFKGIRKLFN
jgi:hypothetical protein